MPGNLVIANLIGASEGGNGIIDMGNATGVVLSDTGNNSIGQQSLASLGLTYKDDPRHAQRLGESTGTIPLTLVTSVRRRLAAP